jgi:hypothetical protein
MTLQSGRLHEDGCLTSKEDSSHGENSRGFYLEYVIQGPGSTTMPMRCPHVMEIVMRHASLSWPYVFQMDFIWAIATTFTRYTLQPYVSPYPKVQLFLGPEGSQLSKLSDMPYKLTSNCRHKERLENL